MPIRHLLERRRLHPIGPTTDLHSEPIPSLLGRPWTGALRILNMIPLAISLLWFLIGVIVAVPLQFLNNGEMK